jgi:hypothetical protein
LILYIDFYNYLELVNEQKKTIKHVLPTLGNKGRSHARSLARSLARNANKSYHAGFF